MTRARTLINVHLDAAHSTRRALYQVLERPILYHVAERLSCVRRAEPVEIVTTTDPVDDPLAEWCAESGLLCHRRPEFDELARVAEVIADLPGRVPVVLAPMCPLMDASLIDQAVAALEDPRVDLATTARPGTWPAGMVVEATRPEVIRRAVEWPRAHPGDDRGQIGARPDSFVEGLHCRVLTRTRSEVHMDWRIERPAQLTFVRVIYEALGPRFDFEALFELLRRKPWLADLVRAEIPEEGMVITESMPSALASHS